MKNFRILTGDEPEPTRKTRLYEPGSFVPFITQISESFTIHVKLTA